jgi:hypothetical protein
MLHTECWQCKALLKRAEPGEKFSSGYLAAPCPVVGARNPWHAALAEHEGWRGDGQRLP